ncbi:uncharacterized protein PODANS_4_9900 [Podospora anserina S mat+]|uniref:Podospora anserina S mat+ genomic DNA chromosome 4, supercontig 3 n=1 Tax=Podospora anserina (strain S / ATCC MYA-4624 / DSM 980 / FGSC 10383) TaxID=515849 RepID=B2AEA7_PODAN|nr:uncharacterized protein PODANS_4_9900 [Podospora anserina S mat+]CAP61773.1 unnamed protein product [Podospora anserina S mat+]CDP28115.1 Putative protein of unknown function [Podospora anserina S mat+]
MIGAVEDESGSWFGSLEKRGPTASSWGTGLCIKFWTSSSFPPSYPFQLRPLSVYTPAHYHLPKPQRYTRDHQSTTVNHTPTTCLPSAIVPRAPAPPVTAAAAAPTKLHKPSAVLDEEDGTVDHPANC